MRICDSVRHLDDNGFLHVETSHISKACVCEYLGQEIPDYQKLGLDPNKIYGVLRPAEELEKAVDTFNGLPLLLEHHLDDADHPSDYRVGSLGTTAAFNAPYLDNGLTVTDSEAIHAIETGEAGELSCCYSYIPVLEDGEYEGKQYSVKMTEIKGNHCALTFRGRCGSDVRVADSLNNLIQEDTKLEEEVKINTPEEQLEAFLGTLTEEQAQVLRGILEAMKPATDACGEEVVADEEEKTEEPVVVVEEPAKEEGEPVAETIEEQIKDAVEESEKAMDSKYRALAVACDSCRAVLGNVNMFSFKEASDVYSEALKSMGISTKGYPTSAYQGMFDVAMAGKAKDSSLVAPESSEMHPAFTGLKSIKY